MIESPLISSLAEIRL